MTHCKSINPKTTRPNSKEVDLRIGLSGESWLLILVSALARVRSFICIIVWNLFKDGPRCLGNVSSITMDRVSSARQSTGSSGAEPGEQFAALS